MKILRFFFFGGGGVGVGGVITKLNSFFLGGGGGRGSFLCILGFFLQVNLQIGNNFIFFFWGGGLKFQGYA